MKAIWKQLTWALAIGLLTAMPLQVNAALKNVMCVKTNTGHYFPVVRVSMMVVVDGGNTFEIVLKDGEGEANVENITFEKHEEDVDFSKYNTSSGGDSYIDMTKKVYLITNTGKYFTFHALPVMTVVEGTDQFDVKVGDEVESNVTSVHFYRGDDPESGIEDAVCDEPLQLLTPVSSQLTISGCGDALQAEVYALDGKKVAAAPVSSGVTTIEVDHLTSGIYIVKVGRKALKFLKK